MNRVFSRRRDRLLIYQTMREGKITSSRRDRKSTRLNSSHLPISYVVFCLKKNINVPNIIQ